MGKQARGKQRAFVTGTDAMSVVPAQARARARETKVVYLWLPRKYVNARGADVMAFLADVNAKITQRGLITYDGQVLRTPITDISVPAGFIEVEKRRIPQELVAGGSAVDGQEFCLAQGVVDFGTHATLIHEGDSPYDPGPQRAWDITLATLFGVPNPYQMSEDAGTYTDSHFEAVIVEPYLLPGELIAALVHGITDDYYLYCECHSAEVVYTTMHRLVCMGCGAMHLALRAPLSVAPKRLFTADEWFQYFDHQGDLRYEEIEVAIVDFNEVENAETIWITDRWESAKHRFVFFARSSPEEIEAAVRGTEADPSVFLEAGWDAMELQPPPAEQLADDSVDVDLIENSAHAARDGVVCFLRAQTSPSQLVNAIPHLFRAIELLLKAKLEMLDTRALADHPNNPAVLTRLAARGVAITAAERSGIDRLRRLRNRLQHGTAKFNYRTGLSVARQAIVFIDRFALQEVDCWLGDVVAPGDHLKLFELKELAINARTLVEGRIEDARRIRTAEITACATCGEQAMVRKHPNSGAVCYYCGHPPPVPEDAG